MAPVGTTSSLSVSVFRVTGTTSSLSVSVFRFREKVVLPFSFIKRKYFPYLRKYFRDRKYFLN